LLRLSVAYREKFEALRWHDAARRSLLLTGRTAPVLKARIYPRTEVPVKHGSR